ncbi:MAG: YeeE/YedE family protein [Deltaproteobacteria bacterium]|nr:YeeE/YedE family protein [Deltaproteobacteria bacterium]
MEDYLLPLVGGLVIGLAAAVHLVTQGRIAGISGMLANVLRAPTSEGGVHLAFLAGLVGVGLVAALTSNAPPAGGSTHLGVVIVGGLLVGFGARRSGGCTAGHGVCGIGRASRRSIVATLVFMATAILTVLVVHRLGAAA